MTRNSNIPYKDWMNLARYCKEYIDGVESFLDFSYSNVVYDNLICYEFVKGYTRKINHGEWDIKLNADDDMDYSHDDIDGLLNDQFRDVAQAEGVYDGPNEDTKKFYNLVDEGSQELYPGCTGFSKLSFTLRLYLLKCLHGWSNESFTSLLVHMHSYWEIVMRFKNILVASTTCFASSKDKNMIAVDLTYYGRIIDIVELDYYVHFKVVLFKCDWYEVENDTYGLTYVYFNNRCSQEETFDRHYVMKIVLRDLFNMSDQVKSNLPQSYENEPSEHLMGLSIPKDNGEVLLTRTDVPETIIDVPSEGFVTQQLEVEYEEQFEDESADEFED
ncbi:hypothetical protein H5410_003590 [Solanum commersonii]|uniref:DUF4216 domain-containing protein n=1 Tax=Solanum commersonii TaxID=4109 RepID=A0A9J6B5B4_SOLCO|nr:hypothetical protein H5410_003590 [Solanum commersonii]